MSSTSSLLVVHFILSNIFYVGTCLDWITSWMLSSEDFDNVVFGLSSRLGTRLPRAKLSVLWKR
jgi:hypothetical protein